MKCPIDGSELFCRTRNGKTVYSCPTCKGLLLPLKELPNSRILIPFPKLRSGKCPACSSVMPRVAYKNHPLFQCSECRLIFLDGSVISELVKKSQHESKTVATPSFDGIADAVLNIAVIPSEIVNAGITIAELAEIAENVGETTVDFFTGLLDIF